jgi:hypothetical protein
MSTNGMIYGTPATNGTFNYTVIITDGCGNKGTNYCTVPVSSVPPTCQPSSVCGFVFADCDGDGFLTPGFDIGKPNVVVTLQSNKVTVATTTTGPDGSYCFYNLTPGTYTVCVTQPGYCNQTAGTHVNHWLNNNYQQCWNENDGYQHCKGADGVDRWTAKDGCQHWKNSNNQDCWKDKYGYSHSQNCNYTSCDIPKGNCETFTLTCGQAQTGVNFAYQGTVAKCDVCVTGPSNGTCGQQATYTCYVTNTGTACWTACKVFICGQTNNCPALSPGQSCSFNCNYQFQNSDCGNFSCTATATCTYSGSSNPCTGSASCPTTVVGGNIANGTYKIISRNSGLALDVCGASTSNGAQIDQYSYKGTSNQKWTVTYLGNGAYKIVGVQSGLSLDDYASKTANGTKIELWNCNGGSNQTWILTPTVSGYYRISPACATGSCLDVFGCSTANSTIVELWGINGGANQDWSFQAP